MMISVEFMGWFKEIVTCEPAYRDSDYSAWVVASWIGRLAGAWEVADVRGVSWAAAAVTYAGRWWASAPGWLLRVIFFRNEWPICWVDAWCFVFCCVVGYAYMYFCLSAGRATAHLALPWLRQCLLPCKTMSCYSLFQYLPSHSYVHCLPLTIASTLNDLQWKVFPLEFFNLSFFNGLLLFLSVLATL